MVRFSPIVLGCVLANLATGTYMAWRGVGTLGALTGTVYGRLLLVKIAGLCALIGLGYLAHRRIADGQQAPVAALRIAPMMTAPVRVKAGVASPAGQASASAPPSRAGATKATHTHHAGASGNGRLPRGGAPRRAGHWQQ